MVTFLIVASPALFFKRSTIADGGLEGIFSLRIEQHGLKANDKKCDVKITQESDQGQNWVLPLTGLETPLFKLPALIWRDHG